MRPEQHGGERAAPLGRQQARGQHAGREAAQQDRGVGDERAEPGAGQARPSKRQLRQRRSVARSAADAQTSARPPQAARADYADRRTDEWPEAVRDTRPARSCRATPRRRRRRSCGASTLPGQMIAFAPSHTPSSTVIGWQKKRNSGSFQSWLPVNR